MGHAADRPRIEQQYVPLFFAVRMVGMPKERNRSPGLPGGCQQRVQTGLILDLEEMAMAEEKSDPSDRADQHTAQRGAQVAVAPHRVKRQGRKALLYRRKIPLPIAEEQEHV